MSNPKIIFRVSGGALSPGLRRLSVYPVVCLAVLVLDTDIRADCIWLHGQKNPVVGRIIRETGESVEIEIHDSASEIKVVANSDVYHVFKSIDSDRLARLRPEFPGEYLDYACELAGYKFDFSAQELAMRLAVIACHHSTLARTIDSDNRLVTIRAVALMYALARNTDPDMADRIRVLARNLGFRGIDGLEDANNSPIKATENNQTADAELLAEIRRLRAALPEKSLPLLDEKSMRSSLIQWQNLLTFDEYQQCLDEESLQPGQLLQLLRLELALQSPRSKTSGNSDDDWAIQSRLPAIPVIEPITTRNVTRFSPDQCFWRNGLWQSEFTANAR